MQFPFVDHARTDAVDLVFVQRDELDTRLSQCAARTRAWIAAMHWTGAPATVCPIPDENGRLAEAWVGVGEGNSPFDYGGLPKRLPPGTYRAPSTLGASKGTTLALGWALGSYAFTRYVQSDRVLPVLEWPIACDRAHVERLARATYLVRDLINTPASDMGPAELAAAVEEVAFARRATCRTFVGEELATENYPAVFAVGRASARAPRLVDVRWGDEAHPKVTLVGKGVCFDSGGLDLKSDAHMKLMKKDMGGAAHVLALGQMIMDAQLPVRLRVLIPCVENSVSGDAMRPLDVLRTRKGLTVEVGHTDAEGRLILCDALTEAVSEKPALVIDMATLTGAARVALGTDVPVVFCNDDALAADLLRAGEEQADPLWRLPLHRPYRKMIDSQVAHLNNVSDSPYGGAITAALFLEEFVGKETSWVHVDVMAWNVSESDGRPSGGEAMGLRALYALIQSRFRT